MSVKSDKLKEIAPHVWSMYQQLTEIRNRAENTLNYFLAINALLLLAFLQLFQDDVRSLSLKYVIPCVLLVIPILRLLAHLFTRPFYQAWIDFYDGQDEPRLTSMVDRNEFYQNGLAEMFSCAEDSGKYRKKIEALLQHFVTWFGAALAWLLGLLVLHMLCCICSTIAELILLGLLTVGAWGAIYFKFKSRRGFQHGVFRDRVLKDLHRWLESGSPDEDKSQPLVS